MRTSHIPACQRANEDAWCGGISYGGCRETGSVDRTAACTALWELCLASKMSLTFLTIFFGGHPFLGLMDTVSLRKRRVCICYILCLCVCTCAFISDCLLLQGCLSAGVFTHCITYISPRRLKSPQVHLYFSHLDHFVPVKCLTLLVSDCFTGRRCREHSPSPLSLCSN